MLQHRAWRNDYFMITVVTDAISMYCKKHNLVEGDKFKVSARHEAAVSGSIFRYSHATAPFLC